MKRESGGAPEFKGFPLFFGGGHLLELGAGDAYHAPLALRPGKVALDMAAYQAQVVAAFGFRFGRMGGGGTGRGLVQVLFARLEQRVAAAYRGALVQGDFHALGESHRDDVAALVDLVAGVAFHVAPGQAALAGLGQGVQAFPEVLVHYGLAGGRLPAVAFPGMDPAFNAVNEQARIRIKFYGFGPVGHGAEGVARATTQAVVLSSVLILVWDYFFGSVWK